MLCMPIYTQFCFYSGHLRLPLSASGSLKTTALFGGHIRARTVGQPHLPGPWAAFSVRANAPAQVRTFTLLQLVPTAVKTIPEDVRGVGTSQHQAWCQRWGHVPGQGVVPGPPPNAGTLCLFGDLPPVPVIVLAAVCLVLIAVNWFRQAGAGAPTPCRISVEAAFRSQQNPRARSEICLMGGSEDCLLTFAIASVMGNAGPRWVPAVSVPEVWALLLGKRC